MLGKNYDVLGNSLNSAALDPGHRPSFYKILLQSDIYALIHGEIDLSHTDSVIGNDTDFLFISWEKSDGSFVIPIFTSEKEISKGFNKPKKYIRINAKIFFNSCLGAQYIINPFSEYSKELTPNEIKSLLDGTLLKGGYSMKLQKDTKVLISQPADYPHILVKSLSTYFTQQEKVLSAYLAQIHYGADDNPHLLIAVGGIEELSDIFSELSVIIQGVMNSIEFVDIIQLGKSVELDTYFEKIEPFYMILKRT